MFGGLASDGLLTWQRGALRHECACQIVIRSLATFSGRGERGTLGRVRAAWICLGLFFTALGFAGVALPLLPGTPFFLLAAWAFARSSPRLHAWLLSLPRIGAAIHDYQGGLGVSRRIKQSAVIGCALAVSLSALLASSMALKIAVVLSGILGVGFVLVRVPTREVVLARREVDEQAARR